MDTLRTPIVQDVPQSFLFKNAKGKVDLVGAYGEIIKHFTRYHHYTLDLDFIESPLMSQIQKKIELGIYNLSMLASTSDNIFANITFSYPIEWSKSCIMVPAKDELPHYWYVVWPFGPYIWILLHLSVVYVAFFMCLLKHPSSRFAHNMLTSLAVMLHSSNMNLKVVNVSLKVQYFYVNLLLMGFILNSYYTSYLTVYNVRPIFQPYLRTVDDILASNIEVVVPPHIFEELRNARYIDHLSALEPVLLEKDHQSVSDHLKHFDRTYAYVVSYNDWLFLNRLQRNLIQPMFHLSDICFGYVFTTIPMQLTSQFTPDFNRFILQVQQSGLWDHWEEQAFLLAIFAKYYYMLEDAYPADALDLNYFKFAWILFCVGNVLSCVCFVMEQKIYKHRNQI